MLEAIRSNLKHFKWILLAIVVSFVLFFGTPWWEAVGGRNLDQNTAAVVNGSKIPLSQFQITARNVENQYRQTFGAQWDQFKDQFDPGLIAMNQLIQRELVLQDAKRLGLSVSEGELEDAIKANPVFQDNGRYVGGEEMIQRMQRQFRFARLDDFKDAYRADLLYGKWQALMLSAPLVSRTEIESEFKRRGEKVAFEYVALSKSEYANNVEPSDSELSAWYEARRDRYSQGEARRAIYVLIDDDVVSDRVAVTDEEISEYYSNNQDQFLNPEQRRARHVLIRVEPGASEDDVSAARQTADQVLARAQAGEDFSALASEFSADPVSAANGGDLGFFGRGAMVPPFEEASFELQPGQVSDVVRTQFGFHVIKLEEIQAAETRPLADVRSQIEGTLRFPKLREAADALAADFKTRANSPETFRSAAEELALEVRETGIITRRSTIPGLGPAPELVGAISDLGASEVSDVISLPGGSVVALCESVIPDWVPPLETQRDAVTNDFRNERGAELAEKALSDAISSAGSAGLARVARTLKTELQTTDGAVTRSASLPGIGVDRQIVAAAFRADAEEIVSPVNGRNHVVAMRVIERESADMSELEQQYTTIENAFIQQRAQQLLESRLEKLQEDADVKRNALLLRSES